jgi:HlyD family secretion protein
LRGNPVFREWAQSWARRTVIKNAIRMISPLRNETETAAGVLQPLSEAGTPAAAMTSLPAFDRFVYVLSVLEKYSDRECSILLDCPVERVVAARIRALEQFVTAGCQGAAETAVQRVSELPVVPAVSQKLEQPYLEQPYIGTVLRRSVMSNNVSIQSLTKNRTAWLIGLAAFLLTASLAVSFHRAHENSVTTAQAAAAFQGPALIAGPGRVEPYSEDIKIGSELSGRLKSVFVEEGDAIRRGQVLAELAKSDYRAQVESAKASVVAKEAVQRKVINGARRQERNEAWSSVNEARAVLENAQSELRRRQQLFDTGVVSREELDRYGREADVAKAKYQVAVEQHSLVDDHAREEDRSLAEADLQLAQSQLEEAQARYEKTFIRSPIDGSVLRKHHRSGESVSNSSTVPDPILTIGDRRTLRVRVDVDETDVGKVRIGQKAYVTADAFGKQKFWGRVVRVGQQLGPKNVRTDEPAEKVDTKILETLVELDPGTQLPDGLRVDAFIVPDGGEVAQAQPRRF